MDQQDGAGTRLLGERLPPAGPEMDAWFSKALDRPTRLVHLDDPTRRPTSPDFSEPGDRVSFADGYPLLVRQRLRARIRSDWGEVVVRP